jgi:uracil-DNA glycosylase family 4
MQKSPLCVGCPLEFLGESFSEPEGSGSLGVLVLAEALGENEARDGLPLRPYAQSGSVFTRALRRAGYSRDQFTLFNTVNCRPPGNLLEGASYESGAVEHCRQHVRRVMANAGPRCILALGNVALRATTGMAGRSQGVSHLRGFVLDSPSYGIPIVGSYHPAFLARGASNLIGVLIHDIQLAVQVAQEGVHRPPVRYSCHPTVAEAAAYADQVARHPEWSIAYDIETNYSAKGAKGDESEIISDWSDITQIQFSHEPLQAIVLPWVGEYIPIAKRILASSNTKLHWNGWVFDEPLLRAAGCELGGASHDLMWAYHQLQPDLPRGLQFVTSFYAGAAMRPWKHLSDAQPEFYGGCDVDSVQRIAAKIFADLQARGVYRSYERHVFRLNPVLQDMCKRGLPIDLERQAEFRKEIVAQAASLDAEIQELVPQELKGRSPKNGFVRAPSELVGLQVATFEVLQPKLLDCSCKESPPLGKSGRPIKCKQCKGTGKTKSKTEKEPCSVQRYYREIPFSALSSQQLIRYMRLRNHPVPTAFKSTTETTGEKELERLWKKTKDPLYLKVLELRKLKKVQSTYVDGWKLGQDGRVHSTFIYAPATGQLSSREPNIQNAPKHGELAKSFRKTIAAKEGHKLVEFDYTAAHALTLGFEAHDRNYMRLARLDIHSFLAGNLLRVSGRDKWLQLPTAELAMVLAGIKKAHKDVRDRKAKPAILGYGFGLGARKLYDMNLESFASLREAQAVIDMLNSLFPKTAQFREDIKTLAHQQSYLLSSHGYIRYLFEAKRWNPRTSRWIGGEDAEKAIAFLPANDAFGHIKDCILRLEERGLLERYGFINQIHDSLMFEPRSSLVDECLLEVAAEMEAPSDVLRHPDVAPHGLAFGIEASLGDSWAELKTVYKTPLEKLL